jgi:hypothetical protein
MSAIDIQPDLPLTKDPTAAERQRRRREKQRQHNSVTGRDTKRDTVTANLTERDTRDTEEPVTPVTVTEEPVTERDGAMILCPGQLEVTAGFNESGDLIITQTNWLDDDSVIVIRAGNLWNFIDQLTDVCGVPTSMP